MKNTETFAIVPSKVLKDRAITIEAKAIYAYLCSFADNDGTCWPSMDSMTAELDCHEDRIRKHLKGLVDAGYVVIERRKKGARFTSNLYYLPDRAALSQTDIPSPESTGAEIPSAEYTSMENAVTEKSIQNYQCFPSPEITGNNNTRGNSTNEQNQESKQTNTNNMDKVAQLAVCFRNQLNAAKARVRSKGRIRTDLTWHISQLLERGYTVDYLLTAMSEYTSSSQRDYDFLYFEEYLKKKK